MDMQAIKIKPVILGATGMVGEGVLHTCLGSSKVEEALVINRKPCGVTHPKLKEIIHRDFMDIRQLESELSGYNACFFCMGVSSVGMKEDDYRRITYDITMHIAGVLLNLNPGMTFCYVSGEGTDSTEKGKLAWARIKGKTENDLLNMGFGAAYMFRPGLIKPIKGMKNTYKVYRLMAPVLPLILKLFPKHSCRLDDLGNAMINCALSGYDKNVLENTDIGKAGK